MVFFKNNVSGEPAPKKIISFAAFWHSSRDVSLLFTSYVIDENEEDKFFVAIPKELEKYTEVLKHDYFRATGFKFNSDDKVVEEIDDLNEIIYSSNNNQN